jgi:hypothetical protein
MVPMQKQTRVYTAAKTKDKLKPAEERKRVQYHQV